MIEVTKCRSPFHCNQSLFHHFVLLLRGPHQPQDLEGWAAQEVPKEECHPSDPWGGGAVWKECWWFKSPISPFFVTCGSRFDLIVPLRSAASWWTTRTNLVRSTNSNFHFPKKPWTVCWDFYYIEQCRMKVDDGGAVTCAVEQGDVGWCQHHQLLFDLQKFPNKWCDHNTLFEWYHPVNLIWLRDGVKKSKWKFKMAFAMKGGVSRGSRVPFTYFEKWFF